MIFKNKDVFSEQIEQIASKTGFAKTHIERDYYLSLILQDISGLSDNLALKGGTALSKVYFNYHRLSEDLDFNLECKRPTVTEQKQHKSYRKEVTANIENTIDDFLSKYGLVKTEVYMRNHHKFYRFSCEYESVITQQPERIKIEINAKAKALLLPTEKHALKHCFENLGLENSLIKVCSEKEIMAEKVAAAINRSKPRDIFDIHIAIQNGFDFYDKEFIRTFQSRLADDRNGIDIKEYEINLGMDNETIKELNEATYELNAFLSTKNQKNLNIEEMFKSINSVMIGVAKISVQEEKGV